MKKTCDKYTTEDISRFVDDELPRDKYDAVVQHLNNCPYCQRLSEKYNALSTIFNDQTDQEILTVDATRLEQIISNRIQNSKKPSFTNIFGFLGRNIYLKLASITAILIIGLMPFQGTLFGTQGPSAIVKSIDTDFASVMIIETQKEKHTIIWFSET